MSAKPLSPIERMIDAATGFKPGISKITRLRVTLRCPKCDRTKDVRRHKTDPKDAVVVEAPCDRCDDGGGFPETMYFDAAGNQIDGRNKIIGKAGKARPA